MPFFVGTVFLMPSDMADWDDILRGLCGDNVLVLGDILLKMWAYLDRVRTVTIIRYDSTRGSLVTRRAVLHSLLKRFLEC